VIDVDSRLGAGTAVTARAFVLPIVDQGVGGAVGVLVAGLSPRLMFDAAYRDFLVMVASQIGTAMASARAFEEAQARAAALAELDRAKTAFFSNVSHEFRTPLTLLLGPTEEAVAGSGSLDGDDLEAVYRTAQRLLKLVNTLLDFSRIEAGRVQASFEPTDLAGVTADLASAFRSATERAGLTLVVECAPLPEPVYVDRDMWEKVVLNLISNAFKFTLSGTIRVSLASQDGHAVLAVADTGVGIAPEDLPRIFQPFAQSVRTAGSHGGTGLGLAICKRLVTQMGGEIAAQSAPDQGATFVVRLPLEAATA
jgi:signal transduction histidine kinase